MALSIKYTPPAYSSLQDDLIYTVADNAKVSDPDTYPNFKFIGDVYVGGNLVARIKRVPNPDTGIGVFNIGAILRNYASTLFNPAAGVLVAQVAGDGRWTASVTMKFGEEWSYTPTFDIVVDTARTFFNNYNGRPNGNTSSLIGKTDKIVSNRPFSGQVLQSSSFYLIPYFPTGTGTVSVVVTPSGGGSGFTTSFAPSAANILQQLNIAPGALNAIHPGAITSATTSYTVAIGAQAYTVRVICEAQYTPYMVHFLNQYGGFDSKIFSKVSRRNLDVTRKDYGRQPYTVDSDGQVSYKSSNGVYNEFRSTYASHYKEKLTLNTDLLTDQEYTWLSDLILSPLIYLEVGGLFYPIVITDNNYESKKVINDDPTNLTINIEFGNQLNAQYR
jgi:hypothetical protein